MSKFIWFWILILSNTIINAKKSNVKLFSSRSSAIIVSSAILYGSTQIVVKPPPSVAATVRTCTKHNVGSLFPRSCSDNSNKESTNSKKKKNNAENNAGLLFFDSVRLAALPITFDSLIAGTAAEACAGVVGAIASRGVADALGDKKVDSLLTKTTTTGAFFGSRGVLRLFARFLGMPRPLAIAFASILASLVSENVKISSRSRKNKADKKDYVSLRAKSETSVKNTINTDNVDVDRIDADDGTTPSDIYQAGSISSISSSINRSGTSVLERPMVVPGIEIEYMNDNSKDNDLTIRIQEVETLDDGEDEKSDSFTSIEIAVDIWKWIQYDFLIETLDFPSRFELQYLEYFGVGAFSSIGAVILGSILEGNERNQRLKSLQKAPIATTDIYTPPSNTNTTSNDKNYNINSNNYDIDCGIRNYDLTWKKMLFSALEGAALFSFYQAFLETGKALLPSELGTSPLFLDAVLETIEKNLDV